MPDATLILIRHAAHGLLGRVLAGRLPGVALNEAGQAQAAALADTLTDTPVRAVWTSPLQRAIETAAPIAARLGIVPIIEPGLNEIDFGDWTGQRFDALESPEWAAWNTGRAMATPPNGEAMLTAQARAVDAMRRAASIGGTVVLISHQDVLKAMLANVLGISLDRLHRFDLDPASRSTVGIGPGWACVQSMNVTPDRCAPAG